MMPKGTFDALKSRGQLRATRACKGRPAEVEYESLPTKYKELITALYGNPYEYVQNAAIESLFTHPDFIKIVVKARDYYNNWRNDSGRKLQTEIPVLVEKTKWMEVCAAIKYTLYPIPAPLVKTLKADKYTALRQLIASKGIKLPGSYDRLMEDVRAYYNDGSRDYNSLISGKIANSNSAKITDAQLVLLKQLHGRQANHNYEKTCMDFNRVARQNGWLLKNGQPLQITTNTAINYLKIYNKQLDGQREGTQAWRDSFDFSISRERPTQPLYLTVHDGWDYERYYQAQGLNSKGQKVTNYWNRKNVVMVLDAYNDYVLGYAIGNVETAELIKRALKNAADHTQQLTGQYCLPWQVKSDNFSIKQLRPFYEQIAYTNDWVTPSEVGNSRDKVIESFFGRFNTQYVQGSTDNTNWSGRGVKSHSNANPDFLQAVKQDFPNEKGVIAQIHADIAASRADKQAQWLAAWKDMPDSERRTITREQYLEIFGTETREAKTLTKEGITPVIDGTKYTYMLFDHAFADLMGLRFTLKYDPDNMDTILAYQPDMKVQYLLPAFEKQPMAFKDATEGDRTRLNKILTFKKDSKNRVISTNKEEMVLVEEMLDAETMLKIFPGTSLGTKHLLAGAERSLKNIDGGLYGSPYEDMEEGKEIE